MTPPGPDTPGPGLPGPDAPDPGAADFRLWVHYGQAYLLDGEGADILTPAPSPDLSAGLVLTRRPADPPGTGFAFLVTGLHTGEVDFSVRVRATDPGPDLGGYEDVVELSVELPVGAPVIEQWGGGAIPLPPLPAGPGWYRLRYHARGFDAAAAADTLGDGEDPIDAYLLQLWPAAPTPPAAVRVVSEGVRSRLNPRRR
ncbi:hypothetical protein [Nocardiopsis trehalosi]|uniref:hypothetical protein n=1 Tax=Nocardiopsis trehalosi TaxID=109329 RepID=UPI0008316D08|nr:hypothetical protein [Nocardiopsis trehalosi]